MDVSVVRVIAAFVMAGLSMLIGTKMGREWGRAEGYTFAMIDIGREVVRCVPIVADTYDDEYDDDDDSEEDGSNDDEHQRECGV